MARMTHPMDFLLHILSYWDSALAVILGLGGLIFFHELGHFIACRLMGIGVVTFSIGMGPKLCSFHRGKTEYRLGIGPVPHLAHMIVQRCPHIFQNMNLQKSK